MYWLWKKMGKLFKGETIQGGNYSSEDSNFKGIRYIFFFFVTWRCFLSSYSGDAMETMLVMVRTLFNSSKTGLPDWLSDYPMLLIQFLFYLYHNVPDFIPAFMTSEVLTALVGTLFPLCNNNDSTRYVYEVVAYLKKSSFDNVFHIYLMRSLHKNGFLIYLQENRANSAHMSALFSYVLCPW